MRREVLHNSISKIANDLIASEIPAFLEEIFDRFRTQKEGKANHSMPLGAFQKYMIATQSYSIEEVKICEIVGISPLLKTMYWQKISELGPHEIRSMLQVVTFTINQLRSILQLMEQHYISDVKEQAEDLPEELKGKSLLTVVIVEEDKHFSSPLRLTSALEAISELYSVVATIENESESDLIVLACDSGSDKSFDFLGLSKVMEEVKEIIFSIWDRVVFHRQSQMSSGLSLISDSLPILEKIAELEKDGTIGQEQSALLKKKIISGATKFIEAGAVIPELESVSAHSPRQLMKPEPKLLVSPSKDPQKNEVRPVEKNQNELDRDSEIFSDEESKMLDLLLKKQQAQSSSTNEENNKTSHKARKKRNKK